MYSNNIKQNTYFETNCFSLFALAPQPLLIKLGNFFSNKKLYIYRLFRDSHNWTCKEHENSGKFVNYTYSRIKDSDSKDIAIILSISGNIPLKDVQDSISNELSIWLFKIKKPNYYSESNLKNFNKKFTMLLNDIKKDHKRDSVIHLFPAVPNDIAISIGYCYNVKSNLCLKIYDRSYNDKKFKFALEL